MRLRVCVGGGGKMLSWIARLLFVSTYVQQTGVQGLITQSDNLREKKLIEKWK